MPTGIGLTLTLLLLTSAAAAPPRIDYEPSISPDGRSIAFISNREGTSRVHVMRANMREVRRVSESAGEDDAPAWSPDGRRIAFTSLIGKYPRLFVINADGTGRRQLTDGGEGAHLHPNWSPDGRRILFNIFADGRFRIAELDLATGRWRVVSEVQGSFASWSPDGSAILLRAEFGANSDIALMSPHGRIVRRLSHDPGFDGWPSFSPNGRCVVFAREAPDGVRSDIFVTAASGGPEVRITSGPGRKTTPRWAADNSSVVFARSEKGAARIVRVAIDGVGPTAKFAGCVAG